MAETAKWFAVGANREDDGWWIPVAKIKTYKAASMIAAVMVYAFFISLDEVPYPSLSYIAIGNAEISSKP